MSFINNLLSSLASGLHKLADSIKPIQIHSVEYFAPEPIGEVRGMPVKGITQYYWFYEHEGKNHKRYLSRDLDKAIARREKLSFELLRGSDINNKPEYSGLLVPFE